MDAIATDPELRQRLARLDRRVRWLGAACALLGGGLLTVLLMGARAPAMATLDVERINIVEPDGSVRLVISNASRFPLPRLDGKDYPRAVQPAGLVFYDAKGDEMGGLALTDTPAGRIAALAFDYPNYDALGLVTRVGADNRSAMTGLQINSHPPAGLDVLQASRVVQRRIAIHNEDENAEILLADPQGRERIRLRVDSRGEPRLEMLDAAGRVVFAAPHEAAP
ncbi:hypothetical protein [Stenotrophomonas mori]|uniref:Uncharacterized protein n=1 Tax=Stenotrophomonas mori TaxID=2871096 RepID=A0ABT0SE62_9GAMM|nr:hypothetical protein [Stenotrophomonas mori]MCL7713329.1 hypothetical protein [Stenotrophomonas mori]